MEELNFNPDGYILIPTKYHGDLTLSKWKWDTICSQPERLWYKFNGEKVSTTLIAPDYVRLHNKYANQVFYYKKFGMYKISESIIVPASRRFQYFSVVIDTETNKICTVWPTDKPRKGKEYTP